MCFFFLFYNFRFITPFTREEKRKCWKDILFFYDEKGNLHNAVLYVSTMIKLAVLILYMYSKLCYFQYTYNNYQNFLCSSGNLNTCKTYTHARFVVYFIFSCTYTSKSKTHIVTNFVFWRDQAFQLVKGKYSDVNHL